MPSSASSESSRRSDYLRVAVPIIVLGALVAMAWKLGYFQLGDPQKLTAAETRVSGTPWLIPIFGAVYTAMVALAFPASPLAYAAGTLFGVWRGSLLIWIASVIGAAGGYWLARGIWSGTAKRLLGRHSDKLRELTRSGAFLTTLRMRILPIVPYGWFTLAAAVSKMPFPAFIVGTAIGVIPGTFAATYVGDRVMVGLRGGGGHPFIIAGVIGVGLFALSYAPTLYAKLRRLRAHPAKG